MNQERWLKLMTAMGLSASLECFESLRASYSERHRHYHTCDHIDAMLRHFDGAYDLAEHPNEVELAIWFHDAIYNPLSSKNEIASAEWAKEFLSAQGYPEEGINRIYQLVMATLHNGVAIDNDQKLLVDIDLSILGASSEIYDEFENNVRNEYKMVPAIIFKKKRKELLKTFLARDSIYNTACFYDKYEMAARSNMSRAIDKL